MTVNEFIMRLAPYVMRQAYRKGYAFPSAIIAQAVLESGEGTPYRSQLCDVFNYWSIKAGSTWGGDTKTITVDEYIDGKWVKVPATFRAYASMEDAVIDYFNFISASRYANLKSASSPAGYIYNIMLDGYATDPTYFNKVMERMSLYDTCRYDVPGQIIAGKWSNGSARQATLKAAGYDYTRMQTMVNNILKG